MSARAAAGAPGAGDGGGLTGVLVSKPLLPVFLLGVAVTLATLLGGPSIPGLIGLAVLVLLILVYPIVGLGSILIISPTYLLISPFVPKGLPVSFLLLILTLLGLAFRRVVERRSAPFRWTWTDVAAFVLLLNGLIYIPKAANLTTGIYGYHELFRLFLIYFVVRLLAPEPRAIRTLLWCVAITGFLIVAYGCIQPFWNYEYIMFNFDLVEPLRGYTGHNVRGIQRAYSVLASPLSLGYLGMIGVLCAVALLAVPGRTDRAARLAPFLLVASAGASALSYTRSSWMGIAVALFVALFAMFRGRDRLLLLVVPPLLGGLVLRFVPAVAERIGAYALTIASQDPAETSLHYVALIAAARFFWAHKLGIGLGTASFAGFQHGKGVQFWSENTYFQMGIQTGFQGMLALILFLVFAAVIGFRLARNRGVSRMNRRIGAATFLGVIGFSVAGISIPTLLDVAAFGPLWVLAALAMNSGDTRTDEAPEAASPEPRP